ncbi:hypothetical protein [Nocardia sp. NPDC051463]|uniref:hypothetical protein n=1 Tax=Nocardia sp. NPDC051463 TaxID=3154845 RepID=UPI003437A0CF
MTTLEQHPAVAVATRALTGSDRDLNPVTAVIRDDVAAVLIDGAQGRWIVFADPRGGEWFVEGTTFGAPRPAGPRSDRSPDNMPLQRLRIRFHSDSKGDGGWLAMTGLAAHDAVSVSMGSGLDEAVASVTDDGLVFAVIRARVDDDPSVYVNTRDGRRISAVARES